MQFSSIFITLIAAASAINENHFTLALDLAKEQGTEVKPVEEDQALEKRGFLLLAKLKYLWALKMARYNVCWQCGGSICGSACCACGSPCTFQCVGC